MMGFHGHGIVMDVMLGSTARRLVHCCAQPVIIICLPEVGEKVLVKFIEPWEDKPIIIGSLRRHTINENIDTAKIKTIRTPGGSQLNMFSDGSKEEIQIRSGKSENYHIRIENTSGKTNLILHCNGKMKIEA